TLAQRRGELRRSLPNQGVPSQLPSPAPAQDLPPARNARDASTLQSSAGAPPARDRVTDATVAAAARLLPDIVPRGERISDPEGLSGMRGVETFRRSDDGAAGAIIAAAAAADGAAREESTANDAQAAAAAGADVFAQPLAAPAHSPADDGLRPRHAASPVAA